MAAKHKPKPTPKGQCETEGCDEPAVAVGLCHNCYNYMYHWTRMKTPAQRRHRQKKLDLFQNRMDSIEKSSRPRRVK